MAQSQLGTVGSGNLEVHNHHNYAWKETHNGKELVVVRKGATPSAPGQVGFIGGSMGDISVIVKGKDSIENSDLTTAPFTERDES